MESARSQGFKAERSLTVCSLLCLLVSCQRDNPGSRDIVKTEARVQYSGEGFRLLIPSSVRVKKVEPIDFIRYSFTSEGKSILDAYVGNQPHLLFDDRATGPETITQLNGLPCKRLQAQKADGTIRTEVLIRFPRDRGWPTYIHFWYLNLEPENQAITEGIIASIQPQTEGAEPSSFPDTGGPDFPPVRLRSEEIISKMEQLSPEEKERRQREDDRTGEEADAFVIAGMEEDLEKMKREQGMTEEVQQWEALILKLKEDLRLLKEKNRQKWEQ